LGENLRLRRKTRLRRQTRPILVRNCLVLFIRIASSKDSFSQRITRRRCRLLGTRRRRRRNRNTAIWCRRPKIVPEGIVFFLHKTERISKKARVRVEDRINSVERTHTS
jgi:hypothetical protein